MEDDNNVQVIDNNEGLKRNGKVKNVVQWCVFPTPSGLRDIFLLNHILSVVSADAITKKSV